MANEQQHQGNIGGGNEIRGGPTGMRVTDEPPVGMTDDDTDAYVRDELAIGPERSGNLGDAADDATKNDPGSARDDEDADTPGGSGF